MRFERQVVATFSAAAAVSAYLSYIRLEEEYTRRSGLKGTSLIQGPDGLAIEYALDAGELGPTAPVAVLESGLGAPLESWDWVAGLLSRRFRVLRYHRSGYWRSKSGLRPAQSVEFLLQQLAPEGDVVLCGHSIGALTAMNVAAESAYVRERATVLHIVDGTDAVLLGEDRGSKRRVARYNQDTARRLLGSALGTTRWLTSPTERELEYRPDIQRAYLASISSPQVLLAARQEYLHEPLAGQDFVAAGPLRRVVISAANNTEQQRKLSERVAADFHVVPASSHRSIIAKPALAQQTAAIILENS
ncbi:MULTISPECIES: alpha/beta hydrolase [unclassified Kitasatospora]|uniref:alpha/beta fold hydrolase n=1 Tax=unclassified Kitasatospora TaxID=2633591 RepID=UPI00343B328F